MKEENYELIDPDGKYPNLLPLYNEWSEKTRFMSVGNMNVPEWDKLVNYCKENKMEAAQFYLDLIEAFTESTKQGYRGSNFVGFFNDIISLCFENEEGFPKFRTKENEYIPAGIVQTCYETYIIWLLGGKQGETWFDRIKGTIIK